MTEFGRALIDQLDEQDLDRLAERLGDRLAARLETSRQAVYSPKTLAAELGRSERSIRAACASGKLQAIKRGRGYVISTDAVAAWASAEDSASTDLLAPGANKSVRETPRSRPRAAQRALRS